MNNHTLEIFRGVTASVLLKSVGAILQFLMTVVISRNLGAADAGLFFLGMTIVNVLSVGVRFGTDNYLVKKISENSIKDAITVCWIYIRKVMLGVIYASSIVALLLWLLSPLLASQLFNKSELQVVLRGMSFVLVFLTIGILISFALQGFKNVLGSVLVQNVLTPLILTLCGAILIPSYRLDGAVFSYVLAVVISAVYGWYSLRSHLKGVYENIQEQHPSWIDIWSESKSFYLMSFMNQVVAWTPLIVIGIMLAPDKLGIFQAAYRTASLVSFVLVASNTIMAPKLAELNMLGQTDLIKKTLGNFTFLLMLSCLPVFLTLLVFSKNVIGIFGHDFSSGYFALRILVLGQFINILAGPVILLLLMTGHASSASLVATRTAIVGLFFTIVFVPAYGINGAAIASALTLLIQNVLAAIEVKRKVGFIPIARPTLSIGIVKKLKQMV